MISLLQAVAKPLADTIAKQAVATEKPVNDTLEILSKVNEFYDSSWNKLLYVLSGAFAILAVIVPIVIQYIQNKSIKASEKELEALINEKIIEAKAEINYEMSEKFRTNILEYEAKIELVIRASKAHVLHLQATVSVDKKDFYNAAKDFQKALKIYIEVNDTENITAALKGFVHCINEMNDNELLNFKQLYYKDLLITLDKLAQTESEGFQYLKNAIELIFSKLNK